MFAAAIPKFGSDLFWIYFLLFPPFQLVAMVMKLTVVDYTQRHRPFVTDFASEGAWLCVKDVVGL